MEADTKQIKIEIPAHDIVKKYSKEDRRNMTVAASMLIEKGYQAWKKEQEKGE